jgi:hypothetical protein
MEKDYAYVVDQSTLLHAAPWIPHYSIERHLFFDGLTASFNDLCPCDFYFWARCEMVYSALVIPVTDA